jgi:hypothetical protein
MRTLKLKGSVTRRLRVEQGITDATVVEGGRQNVKDSIKYAKLYTTSISNTAQSKAN